MSTPSVIFPPVDDLERINISEKERLDFFNHLEKGLQYESTPITLESLKKMREDRKIRDELNGLRDRIHQLLVKF